MYKQATLQTLVVAVVIIFLLGSYSQYVSSSKKATAPEPTPQSQNIVGKWEIDSDQSDTGDLWCNWTFNEDGTFRFSTGTIGNFNGQYEFDGEILMNKITDSTDDHPQYYPCKITGDQMILKGVTYKKVLQFEKGIESSEKNVSKRAQLIEYASNSFILRIDQVCKSVTDCYDSTVKGDFNKRTNANQMFFAHETMIIGWCDSIDNYDVPKDSFLYETHGYFRDASVEFRIFFDAYSNIVTNKPSNMGEKEIIEHFSIGIESFTKGIDELLQLDSEIPGGLNEKEFVKVSEFTHGDTV